jgi:phosphopantothenoylcysteine decarboxylase/phosphopantothenate--cysteine ligase
MLEAVLAALPGAEMLIMAAAVADFRPLVPAAEKIKKENGLPEIRLERTPDILYEAARFKEQSGFPRLLVGFAAESQRLLENARLKLQAKRLDLVVANDIRRSDAGFAADANQVTLLYPDGTVEPLELMPKDQVAEIVLQRLVNLMSR